MTTLATVLDANGARRAAVVDADQAWVTDFPGLDAVLASGLNLADLAHSPGQTASVRELTFDAPLRPPVVFCLGQNYRDHLDEKPVVEVKEPEFFLKAGQTVVAPGQPFRYDRRITSKLDYETELGVVIGKPARAVSAESALDFVAGYLVINDLTARDRQVVRQPDGSVTMSLGPGKNFDGSTRMGPWVRSSDVIGDPQSLALSTVVNGEPRQRNSTASMIFPVAELIAFLSTLLTLQPGAVISTGTPGGTGWGTDQELGGTGRSPAGCVPARYLSPGDVVVGRIEHVGSCEFRIAADTGAD